MGTSQQFCLKWNNHQANLLSVFERLLSNEAFVDVTLACEGLSVKAHKNVLSACSAFFETLFLENPCQHPIVILKDMRYSDLKAIVDFMYRGEVNVPQEQLSTLLKTAETLKIKGLAEVSGDSGKNSGDAAKSDSAFPSVTSRPPSPTSKRKRGRTRRRSQADSNSDSEDQGAPPPTRVKAPSSPVVVEDGSQSCDRVTAPVPVSSARPSVSNNVVTSRPSLNSVTADDAGGAAVEVEDDFEVEPTILLEQSMTTDNVPVFPDVAASSLSSQAAAAAAAALASESQHSHHSVSTSDATSVIPVHASLPSDTPADVDVKPDVSTLVPYTNHSLPTAVPQSSEASGDSNSGAMVFMDTSGVPAIPGPSSSYQSEEQQLTPSHGQDWCCQASSYNPENNGTKKDFAMPMLVEVSCKEEVEEQEAFDVEFDTVCEESYEEDNDEHQRNDTENARTSGSQLCAAPAVNTAPTTKSPSGSQGGRVAASPSVVTWSLRDDGFKVCDQCGYSTKYRGSRATHSRIHTGERPYSCDLCPQTFSMGTNLVRHRRIHTGERPYRCTVCAATFTQSNTLVDHMRVHTGERPYKCTFCPSNFSHKCGLKIHMRSHTGDRPYECALCKRRFADGSSLKRHIARHKK